MAVDIYDELVAHAATNAGLTTRVADLELRVARLELLLRPPMQVGVVSYFFPGPKWTDTLAQRPAVTIINPGSGPGGTSSTSYVNQVKLCRAAGVTVLGYVHTRYGARPIAEVKADIDKHFAWYGVDGIFVDTTSNQAGQLPYYVELCAYIRTLRGKVALNPGTRTLEEHAQMADWVMVAETDLATYRGQTRSPWEVKYPGKLWHVVHTCPVESMPEVVHLADIRGAGLLYVTSDIMPNPYDTLPAYWTALCAEVML